jgi:hypothetical protein
MLSSTTAPTNAAAKAFACGGLRPETDMTSNAGGGVSEVSVRLKILRLSSGPAELFDASDWMNGDYSVNAKSTADDITTPYGDDDDAVDDISGT